MTRPDLDSDTRPPREDTPSPVDHDVGFNPQGSGPDPIGPRSEPTTSGAD